MRIAALVKLLFLVMVILAPNLASLYIQTAGTIGDENFVNTDLSSNKGFNSVGIRDNSYVSYRSPNIEATPLYVDLIYEWID